MVFKKKNYKKILKKNLKLLSFLRKKYPYGSNSATIYLKLKESIKSFVLDSFANNIIFFAVKIDLALYEKMTCSESESISSNCESESESFSRGCKYDVSSLLEEIELIEFAYFTKKKKNVYYLLIGIKGLLGYSNSLLNNFSRILRRTIPYYPRFTYLKNSKKVFSFFTFLVEDLDFNDTYCFKGNFVPYSLNYIPFNSLFSSEEEVPFFEELYGYSQSPRSLKLGTFGHLSQYRSYKYFFYYSRVYHKDYVYYDPENKKLVSNDANNPKKLFISGIYKDTILFFRNDLKIISRKKEDEQSIINLWLIYMKANNLYIKNNKIYEKKDSGEVCYIAELDFLKYNILEIINYVKFYFSFQLVGYPIENLILKYLGLAYEKILINPYYYLPYIEEKELNNLLDKYIKLSDHIDYLELSEFSFLNNLTEEKELEERIESGNNEM